MLIKIYSRFDNTLHIIDGVTDVSVKDGNVSYNPHRPIDPELSGKDLFLEVRAPDEDYETEYVTREITYAKDGICRLFICGVAYICNDDGKTIEKVSVSS